MQVDELMTELVAMYPNQLGRPEVAKAWKRRFLEALGAAQGVGLETAWRVVNSEWDKASFPRPADIARRLPKASGASVDRRADRARVEARTTPEWQKIRDDIKGEFLRQIVSAYGSSDAPPITSHGYTVGKNICPAAYNPANGFSLRLLGWSHHDIEDLADYALKYSGEDWYPLLERILPTRHDVDVAKRMEERDRGGDAGFKTIGGLTLGSMVNG